ncbi:PH domain-containing protein [Corynebacterium sp.]|uniref:PH domain-containing protein n=1 Tax=Corynebacterium sp. TaxID=1720 RepID=UPI0026DD75C7|nr:PH domain-containing protein [Corynebacterium sp.]MDO5031220.1 PH domain-containing protein [Corynebacterium sp.]
MNPVSRKLVTARYIHHLSWQAFFALAAVLGGYFWHSWLYWVAGAYVLLMAYCLWLIPAQVNNMGWQETADELLITRGKLWHTFTVVPYGRIQFVDVTAGPIERALGLKRLEIHTASASSDCTIKGLEAGDADALRERLAIKARERMSGL